MNKEFITPSQDILTKAEQYKKSYNLSSVQYDLLVLLFSNFYIDLRKNENQFVYMKYYS